MPWERVFADEYGAQRARKLHEGRNCRAKMPKFRDMAVISNSSSTCFATDAPANLRSLGR